MMNSCNSTKDQCQFLPAMELSESRFRMLFEQSPFSVQIFSPDGRTIKVNQAWMKLWNLSQELVDSYIIRTYNVFEDQQLEAKGIMPYIRKAFAGEATAVPAIYYETADHEYLGAEAKPRWVEAYLYPIKNQDQTIREVVLIHHDITDKVLSETTFKLLAETGEFLGASLDFQETIKRVSDLAVKWIGDSSCIYLLDGLGNLQQVALDAREQAQSQLAKRCSELLSAFPAKHFGPYYIMHTGQSQFLRRITSELCLPGNPEIESQLQVILASGISTYIGVPLKVQGQLIGVLSTQGYGRYYTDLDYTLMQELAGRAALAIQNSQLYANAKSAIRLRDDFLAVASHELKTPLTSLNLQIQSLERVLSGEVRGGYTPEKILQMLSLSRRQLHNLSDLIEGLLDVTRLAEGKLSLQVENCNLAEIVQEVVNRLALHIEYASTSVNIEVPPTPLIGCWDRFRIEQVVTNLLTNAVKYGGGKPVTVKISKKAHRAVLTVKDHGIGIAVEDQQRIFNRFERVAPSSYFRGMGLGLYITQEIVDLHKGNISVRSSLGEGAEFTVTLPLQSQQLA